MYGGERLSRLGAFSPQFPDAEALHRGLAHWNHERLAPTAPSEGWRDAERTVDRVSARFGTDILRPASLMGSPKSGETAERNGTRQ